MGLIKTRRLARHSLRSACSLPYGSRTPARGGYAMQKQQKYPPNEVSRVAVAMRGAKAVKKPPLPNSRQPKWMSEPSKLMKMAMAMGEYRLAMGSATDPESFDFNRGEYLLCKKRYEEALANAQTKNKPYGII